jgi:hypothetical protein
MAHAGRRSTIYGEASTADGRGLPMTIENNIGLADKAGMTPDRLDAAIEGLVSICEDGAALIDQCGPMLTAYMQQVQKEAAKALRRIEALSEAEDAMTADEKNKIIPGINDQLGRSLDIVNKVTTVLDRVNKMLGNAVKAKDTAVRLRTFIATGDTDTHGLEGMSENALRRMVNLTANGEMLPNEERRG